MDALFGKGVMVVRVFRIGIFGCENCLFLLGKIIAFNEQLYI
jgi:hypothetical protein